MIVLETKYKASSPKSSLLRRVLASYIAVPIAESARCLRARTVTPMKRGTDMFGSYPQARQSLLQLICKHSPLRRDDAGNVLTDGRVAFASAFFESLAVQYFYFAARVLDQPRLLQRVRAQRHRCPLDSKHVR
jgi:hypothetical protein